MKIYLDDNYRLTSTSMNVVVEKKFTIKGGNNKGNEAWRNVGNYSTVRQALKGYTRECEMNSRATSIESLIKDLERAENNITSIINKLVEEGAEPWGRKKRTK